MVILFGVLLVVIAALEYKKRREKNLWEELFLLVFVIFTGLSFVFSQTQNYGLSEVLAFLLGTGLYLVFATQRVEWTKRFLKVIGVGVLLAILVGYIFYSRQERKTFIALELA